MVTTTIKPPSQLQFITFPVFALAWHASPPGNQHSCTAYACCGGGGSAKTGVNNKVQIVISSVEGKRMVNIDTGEDVGVGVALHQVDDLLWVLIAIGDRVCIYVLPVFEIREPELETEGEGNARASIGTAKLMAETTIGEKYGSNAVDFNSMGSLFAVGCENGMLCVFKLSLNGIDDEVVVTKHAELEGHIKAICSVTFHPKNPTILASSAKDGSCRVWDLAEKKCLDVLSCKAHDPSQKPPENPPKPGQLLVRGCAFGDLDGRTIYTVQSKRKGNGFLSVWRLVQVTTPSGADTVEQKSVFQERNRISIAQYPVSAMSLSGDFSTLAFGDTDGTVTLLSTETMKPIKSWATIHDLPVTCIAARPLPFEFPGEDLTGVMVDALSASADNKLLFLTKQYKSTLKIDRGRGISSYSCGFIFYLLSAFSIAFTAFIFKVSFDACYSELAESSDLMIIQEIIQECVGHTVLWAPMDRPGVSQVPI